MNRVLKISILAVLALVTAAVAVLSLVEVDSPALGRRLLQRAGARAGIQLRAEGFKFSPLRGAVLVEPSSRGRLEAGDFQFEASRLVLRHRLLPALLGRLVIHQAIVEQPQIRVVRRDRRAADRRRRRSAGGSERDQGGSSTDRERSDPGDSAGGIFGGRHDARVEVSSLRLENAKLTVAAPRSDRPTAELTGLDLDLRDLRMTSEQPLPILGMSARGRIRAATVAVDDTLSRDLSGRVALIDGVLLLENLAMTHPWGPVQVDELRVEVANQPFTYSLRMTAGALDTGSILGLGAASGLGESRITFEGSGVGPETTRLAGAGTLALSPGRLPSAPVLTSLDRLLGSTVLVGARHGSTEVRYRIEGREVWLEPFRLEVESVGLELAGLVGRDGAIDLRMAVDAPRSRLQPNELPGEVLDALTDDEGRTRVAFSVSGTRERPRVAPDLPALGRAQRRRLERLLEQKLTERLRELLEDDSP